jgi:very-short-patch-repair endonuclease
MSSSHQPRPSRQSVQRQHELACKAQLLRHHPTLTEERLWSELRSGKLGKQFRRQVVIGRFIPDFVCREARLVVEVDGEVHLRRAHLDGLRDGQLRCAGYRVLRIPAVLVVGNLPAALALVRSALGA